MSVMHEETNGRQKVETDEGMGGWKPTRKPSHHNHIDYETCLKSTLLTQHKRQCTRVLYSDSLFKALAIQFRREDVRQTQGLSSRQIEIVS